MLTGFVFTPAHQVPAIHTQDHLQSHRRLRVENARAGGHTSVGPSVAQLQAADGQRSSLDPGPSRGQLAAIFPPADHRRRAAVSATGQRHLLLQFFAHSFLGFLSKLGNGNHHQLHSDSGGSQLIGRLADVVTGVTLYSGQDGQGALRDVPSSVR